VGHQKEESREKKPSDRPGAPDEEYVWNTTEKEAQQLQRRGN